MMLRWTVIVPVAAFLVLAFAWGRPAVGLLMALVALALVGAVIAAVHHAEIVAHRVGEPFGTLILAIAVTVIEVGLIVILMSAGGAGAESLARDTVFSAFMIVCNGVMGLCLLVGALKHHVLEFRVDGVTAALATLSAVATLALVLPNFTLATPGPTYSAAQLAFAGIASLVLYGVFVFMQTVRHRDYFLPVQAGGEGRPSEEHADPPTRRTALISLGLMLICLVSVVGLAKTVSPAIEESIAAIGAPRTTVGVTIALLVLLPETVAAVRAAARNRVQNSFNLALGSALASIGLTIPAIAVVSLLTGDSLALGLGPLQMVLLALTVVITTLTVAPGRATLMQGTVHLVLFGAFLFLAVSP
ncbi:hypothetical protein [Nonomuraea sp. NPDC003804]|uniref:calcium:proton antiporter n=1 Tax=Nonomuraea sp. NPDC003804 TaxID=3154547 RepID=UPI0033BA7656